MAFLAIFAVTLKRLSQRLGTWSWAELLSKHLLPRRPCHYIVDGLAGLALRHRQHNAMLPPCSDDVSVLGLLGSFGFRRSGRLDGPERYGTEVLQSRSGESVVRGQSDLRLALQTPCRPCFSFSQTTPPHIRFYQSFGLTVMSVSVRSLVI